MKNNLFLKILKSFNVYNTFYIRNAIFYLKFSLFNIVMSEYKIIDILVENITC